MDKTHFIGFFHRILRILLHLKQLSHKTKPHKRSENLPFSRNLVTADRKRRGQGGIMKTKDHKRSDASHIALINQIQCSTIDCDKLGLMWVQKRYIDASSAQVCALLCLVDPILGKSRSQCHSLNQGTWGGRIPHPPP